MKGIECPEKNYHPSISKCAEQTNDFFFIQIGANDGVTWDPLHKRIVKYDWSGVLVEPVKYLFNKLKKNYEQQKKLSFENAAIANKNGYRKFYRLRKTNDAMPIFYDQLGSFFPEVIISQKKQIPNFEKYFITEVVKCITFKDLIKKHNVKKIDLLLIDAEGYDFEILKSIDFAQIKPKMIVYEYLHLSDEDKQESMKLLIENGYSLMKHHQDIFAQVKQ